MIWRLLADLVLIVHLAFVFYVVLGALASLRWRANLFVHPLALAWGLWIEFSGRVCPLTPLEDRLRLLGGEAGYTDGFIRDLLLPILYPPGLTPAHQWVLGALALIINLSLYAWLWRRGVIRRR